MTKIIQAKKRNFINPSRFEANIIAHSINEAGVEIVTFECVYPYVIHAEVMTHRVFSRNAASFRAVPTHIFIDEVMKHPFVPIHWGKNQRGMQAYEEQDVMVPVVFDYWDSVKKEQSSETVWMTREDAWLKARDEAVRYAKAFNEVNYHKQVMNRLLAPFTHMRTVITSTKWANFEALRNHKAAEPGIQRLSQAMIEARKNSVPKLLRFGEWHLPYADTDDVAHLSLEDRKKVSAERCARVSYKLRDDSGRAYDPDFSLFKSLIEDYPMHASPIEHQATPDRLLSNGCWENGHLNGNFHTWIQERKLWPNEYTADETQKLFI